jgi:hypothetical protein
MNAADDLQSRWWKLEEKLMERFGKKPDMESISSAKSRSRI